MFGGKKKESDRPVPIDRVRAMSRSGMPDKDIIKQLKSEGYSYNDIEKAMLQSVKEGVSNDPFAQSIQRAEAEMPRQVGLPTFEEEFSGNRNEEDIYQEVAPEEVGGVSPEVIMEELIEEVVAEKVARYEDRLKKIENSIALLRAEVKHSSDIITTIPAEGGQGKEQEDALEELEARVGGLEKAFKQFLPSLTQNIESLSDMIHEMKERRGLEAEVI
jgi:DNA-binding transcriptional MerR regulator